MAPHYFRHCLLFTTKLGEEPHAQHCLAKGYWFVGHPELGNGCCAPPHQPVLEKGGPSCPSCLESGIYEGHFTPMLFCMGNNNLHSPLGGAGAGEVEGLQENMTLYSLLSGLK